MKKTPVAVLGATGMVGQRLLQLLDDHPWFEVAALAASHRSAGKRYQDACTWFLPGSSYAGFGEMTVTHCDPAEVGVKPPGIAISALDSDVARRVEPAFADSGWTVVSNASAFRMAEQVPLIIPEVNPDHLELTRQQPHRGCIVTNPNCTSIPLTLALAPIMAQREVEHVNIASYQAISGAGYPGESAWDILGNVHPHPGDEELKVEEEPRKILGRLEGSQIVPAEFRLSARCVRVPVVDGHLVAVSIKTRQDTTPDAYQAWVGQWNTTHRLDLPSAPQKVLHLVKGRSRPTPRQDAMLGDGMSVAIGRVEPCPVADLKLFALSHNTIRGAAGAALLNAELMLDRGYLKP